MDWFTAPFELAFQQHMQRVVLRTFANQKVAVLELKYFHQSTEYAGFFV